MAEYEHIKAVLDKAADFAFQVWHSHARGARITMKVPVFDGPDYFKEKYANSIKMGSSVNLPTAGVFTRSIIATDPISADLENGKPPWDMKPMLLGGPAVKMGKHGRYVTIPMRHRTPSATPAPKRFSSQMTQETYESAKKLAYAPIGIRRRKMDKRLVGYSQTTKGAERLTGTGPLQTHNITHSRKSGKKLSTPVTYTHKTPIAEGMMKLGKPGHSHYLTMRTVSDRSDPSSWWHPGWKAYRIAQSIVEGMRPKLIAELEKAAVADLLDPKEVMAGMNYKSMPMGSFKPGGFAI